MNRYNTLKAEILQINRNISLLFSELKTITGTANTLFNNWEKTCSEIHKQITDEMVRVAIVGSIKSGKSTFTNSIFLGDYLKRGAGVVTSFVTKTKKGDALKAKLLFKSWDEINTEMAQAMVLFPPLNCCHGDDVFDMRRKEDRERLKQALDSLNNDSLVINGIFNPNGILLSSYLKGYERIKNTIAADAGTAEFEGEQFAEHRIFVSDDTLSVYLKDIHLEIDSGNLNKDIEIADCQGSDSPNPLHFAMIQNYLLLTHLIIYVISSRTGLREADIKFLSMIKKMGIIDNIFFVINCDFGEHESIDELDLLIKRVKENLSLITPDPEVFTFSALYNLFKALKFDPTLKNRLKEKDSFKVIQWEKEKDFTAFSRRETERFESSFNQKLRGGRYALLLKNHLERLGVMTSGIDNWIRTNRDVLNRDAVSAQEVIEKIKQHQERMNRIKNIIKNTLAGAVQKTNNELKIETDRFFIIKSGNILYDLIEFIRSYRISLDKYEKNIESSGFANTLYFVFQEFKQEFDRFMAQEVNPDVIKFIRDKDRLIKDRLEEIADPYDAMIQDALLKYNASMEALGITHFPAKNGRTELPDMDSIRTIAGLTIPVLSPDIHCSAKIKTEAVIRLGFYSALRLLKKIFKKQVQSNKGEAILALQDSILRIKRETEKSVIFYFKSYKENLKFQYIFKLVEAASNNLYRILVDRFQANVTDLSTIAELIGKKHSDKKNASEILDGMGKTTESLNKEIAGLRKKIKTLLYKNDI